MEQETFEQLIKESPALSVGVKNMLLESAAELSDEAKWTVIDTLVEYEAALLEGIQTVLPQN